MSYKEKLQPMDIIVVYNPKSWLHRMIFKVTGYKAGHVALYVGDGMIYEQNSLGVNRRTCKNYTDYHHITLARVQQISEVQELDIRNFCFQVECQKYAFMQLVMMFLKYTFRLSKVPDVSKKAMICSEFVDKAFKVAGIDLTGKASHEVCPSDIVNSQKIWRIVCQ